MNMIRHSGLLCLLTALMVLGAAVCGESATSAPTPAPTTAFDPPPTAATPTASPATTPTEAPPTTSTITRLIVANIPPQPEALDPSLIGTFEQFQFLPMMDNLLGFNHTTGIVEGRAAKSWSGSPDGRTWTFELNENVPFHFGKGTMTSEDWAATFDFLIRDESLVSRKRFYKLKFGIPADSPGPVPEGVIDTSDPNVLVFNLAETDARFFYDMTDYFEAVALSKAQLAEPYDEWTKTPAGIGSYQLLEANVGENRIFENAPGTHYFQEPAFDELQIFFVLEPSTRLAMLLSEQAHIADLPRELAEEGEQQGLRQWLTTLAPSVVFGVFGGNFAGPPLENGDPDYSFPLLNEDLPWTKKEVRQAMNMAINRNELIEELFADSAIPIIGPPMWWPRNDGWNPQWVEDFPDLYRYDPVAAKELLAEAGYPDGFTAEWKAFARPGVPWRELVEATVGYMREIGVDLNVEELEFQEFRNQYRQFNHSGWAFWWTAQENLPSTRFGFHHNMRRNQQQWYVTEKLQRNFDTLETTVPQDERHAILEEMGNELFYDFALMPLAAVRPRYVANPSVVAEFLTTGLNGVRDLEFVVPAR